MTAQLAASQEVLSIMELVMATLFLCLIKHYTNEDL
jgi:hypothetical protein